MADVEPMSGDPVDPDLDWILRRLRLFNTRNRLTHLILLSAADTQAAFLRSGALADLEPLSQAALCRLITSRPQLARRFLPASSGFER